MSVVPSHRLETARTEGDVVAETRRGICIRVPALNWRVGGHRRRVVVTVGLAPTPRQIAAELRALADEIEGA